MCSLSCVMGDRKWKLKIQWMLAGGWVTCGKASKLQLFKLQYKLRLTFVNSNVSPPSSTTTSCAREFLSLSRIPLATCAAFSRSNLLDLDPHHWKIFYKMKNRHTRNGSLHVTVSNAAWIWMNTPFTAYSPEVLTCPRSTMKQSPLLKLDQLRGTWVARTTRRPLMCSSRSAERSLVTTWWKPEATPPIWGTEHCQPSSLCLR